MQFSISYSTLYVLFCKSFRLSHHNILSTYCYIINFINILLHIGMDTYKVVHSNKLYISSCIPSTITYYLTVHPIHIFYIVPCASTLIVFNRIQEKIFLYAVVLLVLSFRHCYLFVPESIVSIDVLFFSFVDPCIA